jgi:hypothetical protein
MGSVMNKLERAALMCNVISHENVSGIYSAAKDMHREHLIECVMRLAESHERLRLELCGATAMYDAMVNSHTNGVER